MFYLFICVFMNSSIRRWGACLTIRIFWTRPNHHRLARLAIALLPSQTPIFRFKTSILRTEQHSCLRHLHHSYTNHTLVSELIQRPFQDAYRSMSLAVALGQKERHRFYVFSVKLHSAAAKRLEKPSLLYTHHCAYFSARNQPPTK